MKFKLDTPIPNYKEKITYDIEILFLGSCFSDEMGKKFMNAGFKISSNPFGTIFHPIPLARLILACLDENQNNFNLFNTDKYWKSWDTSSYFQASKKEDLESELNSIRQVFKQKLKTASHFFITFGTAWGYVLNSNKLIVANCHKENGNLFTKKLTQTTELIQIWEQCIAQIKAVNPSIDLIFTVSPVRHSKDGLVENNRSKAKLFELISALENSYKVQYFPSYEIVMDELRDYRFYTEDLVHPNGLAIQYIWEIINSSFFSDETRKIVQEVEKMRLFEQHKIQTPNEEEKLIFESNRNLKIQQFLEKYPFVKW